jgi:hypothetical protein
VAGEAESEVEGVNLRQFYEKYQISFEYVKYYGTIRAIMEGDIVEILIRMEMLLRRYGYAGHANTVAHAITLARRSDPDLQTCLEAVDFWGGFGSIWELYLDEEFTDKNQQNGDTREFDLAVVKLAEAMKSRGWDSPRIRQVANLKKDWNPVHNPRILLQFLYVLAPLSLIAIVYIFWDRW